MRDPVNLVKAAPKSEKRCAICIEPLFVQGLLGGEIGPVDPENVEFEFSGVEIFSEKDSRRLHTFWRTKFVTSIWKRSVLSSKFKVSQR